MPVIPLVSSPGSSPTTSDLLEQTRGYLLSSHRDQVNRLASAAAANDTSLSFEYPIEGLDRGSYLSVGLETFQVFDASVASKSATVMGATRGSTAAAHDAGEEVFLNPEFSNHAIFRELNMELRALSAPAALFQVRTVDLTFNAARVGYDLTGVTGLIDVLDVQWEAPDSERAWPHIRPSEYRVVRSADPTDFPSGLAIMIYAGGHPGRTVRVTYAKEFGLLSSLADNVITVSGLPESAVDIPALGAAARLVGAQESKRNLMGSQRDPRRSEEVPAGAQIGAARFLMAERQRRIAEERSRLLKRYPVRVR